MMARKSAGARCRQAWHLTERHSQESWGSMLRAVGKLSVIPLIIGAAAAKMIAARSWWFDQESSSSETPQQRLNLRKETPVAINIRTTKRERRHFAEGAETRPMIHA